MNQQIIIYSDQQNNADLDMTTQWRKISTRKVELCIPKMLFNTTHFERVG